MGRRLKHQRKGKGSQVFQATKNALANTSYPQLSNEKRRAQVLELETDCGRSGVLAKLLYESGKSHYLIAAEGEKVGQTIEEGKGADILIGNILPLEELPEGCPVFNIERIPGDGGSLVRASGLYGLVMSRERNRVFVKLPSGKMIALNPMARATIGCSAGGGRKEKPMMKAGTAHFLAVARGRAYPVVRGVAMNPPSHPFGGSQHHPGKSKSVARGAPPGRKVGAIASKRTGRRKKN